jgi:hypothetical protein
MKLLNSLSKIVLALGLACTLAAHAGNASSGTGDSSQLPKMKLQVQIDEKTGERVIAMRAMDMCWYLAKRCEAGCGTCCAAYLQKCAD